MQGRKTTTRAVPIDETVDRQLREWAEREGVSVSFLANKALRRLVEWDMYADRFGFIAMPREALSRMIELLSEDEVRDLGRWAGEDVYRAFTTFMFKHLDLETVLQVIPRLASRYTKAFEYEEKRDGSRTVIVLRHGSGHKYSLFSSFNLSSSACCSTFFAASACFSRSVAIAFRAFVRRLLIGSASDIRWSSSSAFAYPSSPSPNVAPSRVR